MALQITSTSTVATSVKRREKRRASILSLLIVAGAIALALAIAVWRMGVEKDLAADLRDSLTGVEYIALCEQGGSAAQDSCRFIDEASVPTLRAAILNLSAANTSLFPPGKNLTVDQKILKLGRGIPASKNYLRCYRLVQYAGWPEVSIQPVSMNRECTIIEKFLPGDLRVSSTWSQG